MGLLAGSGCAWAFLGGPGWLSVECNGMEWNGMAGWAWVHLGGPGWVCVGLGRLGWSWVAGCEMNGTECPGFCRCCFAECERIPALTLSTAENHYIDYHRLGLTRREAFSLSGPIDAAVTKLLQLSPLPHGVPAPDACPRSCHAAAPASSRRTCRRCPG